MDVSSTAAIAAAVRQAETTHGLSLLVVRQQIEVQQAVVQMLAEANQTIAAANKVDIAV